MASMSLTMSPKVLLPSKNTYVNIETPRLCNMVTFARKGYYTNTNRLVVVRASPNDLSEKNIVEQSIKAAQETCSDNPESGECAAAWDEVEEVSAAISHAKDKNKSTDVLEEYCKDNPETDECRTYDN